MPFESEIREIKVKKKNVNFIIQRWFLVIRAIVLIGGSGWIDRSIAVSVWKSADCDIMGRERGAIVGIFRGINGAGTMVEQSEILGEIETAAVVNWYVLTITFKWAIFFFSLPFFFGLVSSRCVKGCALYRHRQIHLGIFPLENDIYIGWLGGVGSRIGGN